MRNRATSIDLRTVALLLAGCLGLVCAAPAHAAPTLTKTAALAPGGDADSSGTISPGDTLRYTVTITGTATNAGFGDAPAAVDSNLTLVAGSVNCSGGSICNIIQGNTAGDTQIGIQVGDITTSATITFDVTIKNPLSSSAVPQQVINTAGISCDECGTDGVGNYVITAVDAAPILTITKTAALQVDADSSSDISPGDTLRYTVTVTNSGNQDAALVFGDGIPDANTSLVNNTVTTTQGTILSGNTGEGVVGVDLGDVPGVVGGVNGQATITFDVLIANPLSSAAVPPQVVDQGGVTCTACTPQDQPTDDPSTDTVGDPTITPVVAAPSLTVTKTAALQVDADSSSDISPGDTLRYTVTVTNSGNQDAAVVFTDAIPDPNTSLVNTTVTTTQGTILSGNGGEGVVGVDLGDVPGVIGGVNGVATITFDVLIKNPLSSSAVPPQVVDQGGVTCTSCTPQDQPTDDPSTGTVGDPTITPVVAAPSLTVTKTAALQTDADSDTNISPGDTLRYTVTVTNSGNQDAAVVFTDAIPDPNTSLVNNTVTTTQGTILSGNTGEGVVGVDLGDVSGVIGGVNGVATITFDVLIKNPLPAFVNQVVDQGGISCTNCDPQSQPTDDPSTGTVGDATITPVVAAPIITATKTVELFVDQNNDGQVNPNDILKYTVVVTNSGNQDAAGVLVLDPPAPYASPYLNLVVGSVTTTLGTIVAGNSPGDPIAGVQIATLAGLGGSATITVQMQVKPTVIGNVTIQNQASVAGGNFQSTATNTTLTPAYGPVPAPTIAPLGLLVLIILLAGVAVLELRRAAVDRAGG